MPLEAERFEWLDLDSQCVHPRSTCPKHDLQREMIQPPGLAVGNVRSPLVKEAESLPLCVAHRH